VPTFLNKLVSLFSGRPRYHDLKNAQFVSNWTPLVQAARQASAEEPLLLPLKLTPGFLCSGSLSKVVRSRQGDGWISIDGKKTFSEEYEALNLHIYPREGTSRSQLPDLAERRLKPLYFEIIRQALESERTDRETGFLAMRLLARLKQAQHLDATEKEFLRFLESAPVFPCYQQLYPDIPGHPVPEPTPRLLPLRALQKARVLSLGPEDTGPMQDTIDMDEEGQLNFEVSYAMVTLTKLYGLPTQYATPALHRQWSPSTAPPVPPPPPRDPDEVLAEQLHDQAVAAQFGKGRVEGQRFVVPSEPDLELDFAQGILKGRSLSGKVCCWPLQELTQVKRLERDVWGDTKIHQYRYLLLARGEEKIVYYERMKEYFESSRLDYLDEYQDRAKSILSALAELQPSAPLETWERLSSIC
jgi:hypothetical protein